MLLRYPSGVRFARFISPLVLVMALAPSALADEPSPSDVDSARAAFLQGLELRDKRNDLPTALARFKAAYALVPTPRIGFEIGKTLRAMGDLVGARAAFIAATQLPIRANESAEAKKARTDSDAQSADLDQRIPQLLLHIIGTGQIYVDGEGLRRDALAAPRRVNPGQHKVQLQVDGDVKSEQTITLREGDRRDVTMSPGVEARITVVANTAPPPPVVVTEGVGPDPNSPYGTYRRFTPLVHSNSGTKAGLAYAAYTLGGVGVIPGVIALAFMKSAQDSCTSDGVCNSDFGKNKDFAYGFAVATDVIWGVAIICAIAAIAIPTSNTEVTVGASPLPNGGGYLSATGHF